MANKLTSRDFNESYNNFIAPSFNEEENRQRIIVLNMYEKAVIKARVNKNAQALICYEQAENYFHKMNFNIKQKRYINKFRYANIALLFFRAKDYDKARNYTDKCISCMSEIGKEYPFANLGKIHQLHNLIRIFYQQRNYEEYFDQNFYIMNFLLFNEICGADNKVDLPVELMALGSDELFRRQFNDIFLEFIVNLNVNCEIPYEKICFFDPFIKKKREIDQGRFEIFDYFIQCLSSINKEVKDDKESIVDKLLTANDDVNYRYVKILLYVHEFRKQNQLKSNKDPIRIEHIQQKIQIALDRIGNRKHLESIKLKLFKNGILKQEPLARKPKNPSVQSLVTN